MLPARRTDAEWQAAVWGETIVLPAEGGIPLTDHRTPPERVDDLAARFTMLGIDPEAPRPVR